jgi:Cu(I)/Ag(I) efflux system protein CusF
MKSVRNLLFALFLAFPGAIAHSQTAASHQATGVVKSVDAAKSSVMLAHDPVKSLKWPAMTMGFTVREKSLLDKLQPGKKVEFEFVQQGRDYVITSVK